MSDHAIIKDSLNPQIDTERFVKREWSYVLDLQNGNYTSAQSIIDCSPLSNSGRWDSLREAYIEVPLVMYLKASTAITGLAATSTPYAMGLKNGSFQILHSLSVEWNGQTLVKLAPFLNTLLHFQAITSFSRSDLDKQLISGIYFTPDSEKSAINVSNTAGAVSSSLRY